MLPPTHPMGLNQATLNGNKIQLVGIFSAFSLGSNTMRSQLRSQFELNSAT